MQTPEVTKAVIGGTGFSETATDYETIETDYGDVRFGHLELGGKEVFFVSRHAGLEVPHLVNYRANIQALKLLGVNSVFAVSACGRLAEDMLPGHLVAVSDVDWDDLNREMTFAESGLLLHASLNEPFSAGLRDNLIAAWQHTEPRVRAIYGDSSDLAVGFHTDGVYFNIQGPSFSTPAREARIRALPTRPKVIGQTLVPEVQLAREMGIAYAALGMCVDHSNYPGAPPVTHAEGVMHAVVNTAKAAVAVLDEAVRLTPDDFFDQVAHTAFDHSLSSGQVNLRLLEENGRTRLAVILDSVLNSRNT